MIDNAGATNVRQLCLRLKPILGSKVDQIYSAYLAEDTEGRDQIQHYLELLTAKYIPQTLGQSDVALIPPTREQAGGEYPIGQVCYAGKTLYDFGLREDEWIQHMAILGRSGAGKTNVGFLILNALRQKGKIFTVLDWKRNYRDLLSLPEFAGVEVYTIGRNVAPLTFNPLIPPAGTDPKAWLKKLNEVIAHSYCLGNGVLFLLQQAVDSVYQEAGVYAGTVQKWPTFKDVLLKARNMDTRGRESGWLSSTLRALSSLCFGDMDKLLNTNNNKSFDHILDKSVILELDALTQSDKVFFTSAVLLWLHHKRMTEGYRETFKHCTIIEESHHILSDERRSLVGGQSVMEIVFREIREFGEALILLDQHPSKISLPALGNTYTTVCLGLKHKTDINAMGQCLLLDRERDILGMLGVGEAVVKLQGRIPGSFQITIPQFKIEKGKITDELITVHMRNMVPILPERDLQKPPDPDAVEANAPKSGLEETHGQNVERAFLNDVQEHPESGIAARYRRLGLSVRRGQKVKTRLLEQKLIEEHLHTTTTGRLASIRLTQDGKRALKRTTP
ncbi:MAG: ATP-binding protein [Planctomycetota bacterium]|jgi:hypothetical protein